MRSIKCKLISIVIGIVIVFSIMMTIILSAFVNLNYKNSYQESVESFVDRAYLSVLGREADDDELNYWSYGLRNRMVSAADFACSFVENDETLALNLTDEQMIEVLHLLFFSRPSDSSESEELQQMLDCGMSFRVIINEFVSKNEFITYADSIGIDAGYLPYVEARDRDFLITKYVSTLFYNFFEREVDIKSLNKWTQQLIDKEIYADELIQTFMESIKYSSRIYAKIDYVDILNLAFFNETHEESSCAEWVYLLDTGATRDEVLELFIESERFALYLEGFGLEVAPRPETEPESYKNGKIVALTFDDGPYSPVTNRILDQLEKVDGKATFFVVGDRIDDYSDCVIRANEMGCEIAVHSYDHKKKYTALSSANIISQITQCSDKIYEVTGQTPVIMRPVGGSYNDTVSANVGLPMIIWSIDTEDWKSRDSSLITSAIIDDIEDGDIILMHDLYSSTADAMNYVIPELAKEGWTFVTVSELAEAKGYELQAGEPYWSFK